MPAPWLGQSLFSMWPGLEILSLSCGAALVTGLGKEESGWTSYLLGANCGDVISIAVDLLFLTIWSCWLLWTRIKIRRNQHGTEKGRFIRVGQNCSLNGRGSGFLYNVTLVCGVYLLLSNLGVAGWTAVVGWNQEWPNHHLLVGASSIVHSGAWLVMITATKHTKRRGMKKYGALLRAWWVISFAISLQFLIGDIFLLTKNQRLSVADWVEMISIVPGGFLCVAALHGGTGLRPLTPASGLRQPLLSDLQREHIVNNVTTPYETAGIFSYAFITWLNPLLAVGSCKTLELEDVPLLARRDRAEASYDAFKENWDRVQLRNSSSTPSLFLALGRTFWQRAVWNGLLAMINSFATYVGPYLIVDFVEYLGGRQRFAYEGYILVGTLFGSKIVETLSQRQCQFGTQVLGLYVRSALTAIVYRKGLRLSSQSRMNHASGEIINYMAVDVERIGDFAWYLHDIWVLPLQVFLALAILYKNVGCASFAALFATVIILFVNQPIADIYERYQDNLMNAKDERMKALSECLRNMRILKLQAWENRYLSKLESLRKVEYDWLASTLNVGAISTFIFWTAPMFVAAVTFGTCVLLHIPLTTGRILSALATFRVLQTPLDSFPEFVTILAQTKVSLERVRRFLQEHELPSDAVLHVPYGLGSPGMEEIVLEIKQGDFSWDPSFDIPTLRGVSIQVRKGARVAICGMVGSGKSSFLSCILGEIPKLAGTVTLSGSTAYVPQTPWIQSGSIEDNIRFGSQMDHIKYMDVLKVCALEKDLKLFSYGDQTLIGERGINLSGGQKQRVQLARAVYQDADVYLLDDPFSAVDAHTGTYLFKECLLGTLVGKTVIFVTHQVEFLPAADLILVMRDGEIVQAGKYHELLQAGTDFSLLVSAHNEAIELMDNQAGRDSSEEVKIGLVRTCEVHPVELDVGLNKSMKKDCEKTSPDTGGVKNKHLHKKESILEKPRRQLLEGEEREVGSVKFLVYWSYLTAVYSGAFIPVILLSQILFQVLQIGSNYWMAWATPTTSAEKSKISSETLILIYVALAFGCSVCVLVRTVLVSLVGLLTAQKFFLSMLRCLFGAPMAFFDSTPTGRILSRASTDQTVMDLSMQFRLNGLMVTSFQVVGIVVVMAQMTQEVFFVFLPVVGICIWIQRYYMMSARELQRLVGIQKAPVIHHYAESIAGAATIRAFGQELRFINTNFESFDRYARPFFHNFAAAEWLIIRMEMLSTCIFAFSMIAIIIFPNGKIDPSMAGLAVTYGLQLNSIQSRWVWGLCSVENKVISVERIQQYTRIPSEATKIIENSRPPPTWPTHGTIRIQNLQVCYSADTPKVLHGVTCTFPGGKKVGVVGRTGSGKSTLIQALFRMVEPVGGNILIDGLDVSTIGLHDLRARLSIIPQDPSLFEGTIRGNLDPLEEHADSEIWEAIDKCQLGDVVRGKEEKLNAMVCENGENWSVGQRQLVCLGRALLKHTRILILDEATASVDSATDGVIQHTLRSEFSDCTVITVAHRIPTVVDSDFVLVLRDGRVAEYDVPGKLLKEKYSLFSRLVAEYSSRSSSVTHDVQ